MPTTRNQKRLSESEGDKERANLKKTRKSTEDLSENDQIFQEGEPDHCDNIWLMWETVKEVNKSPETEHYLIPVKMIKVSQYLGNSKCEILYGESDVKVTSDSVDSLDRLKSGLKKDGRRFLYKIESSQDPGEDPTIEATKISEVEKTNSLFKKKQKKNCNCKDTEFCCFTSCEHENPRLDCKICKDNKTG